MKKCIYCGREYPDEATICALDEYPLAQEGSPAPSIYSEAEGAPARWSINYATETAAKKAMFVGGLWCAGGIIVTLVTYSAATSNPGGGTYVVAWGAIIFGAIRFFRGLAALNENTPVDEAPAAIQEVQEIKEVQGVQVRPKVVASKKPWVCANCGETSESHFTSCWKCQSPRPETV